VSRRDHPLALAPGLYDVTKKVQKRLEGNAGRGKGKDHSPHLLIAVKPPMIKPSEMSSSGFVILNRTSKKEDDAWGEKRVSS
jgi:hypothetical protein